MTEYEISTDPKRLDLQFVVCSLQTTYWAEGRTREAILESFRGSLVFGVYAVAGGEQVGFARIITDGVTFSWLCDVFVVSVHRGRGLGKRLVAEVLAHPRVKDTRVYLGTKDAHGLYEKFGFTRWELMRHPGTPNPC